MNCETFKESRSGALHWLAAVLSVRPQTAISAPKPTPKACLDIAPTAGGIGTVIAGKLVRGGFAQSGIGLLVQRALAAG